MKVSKNFRIDETLVQKLEKKAKDYGISMTDILEEALAEHFKNDLNIPKMLNEVFEQVSQQLLVFNYLQDQDEYGGADKQYGDFLWKTFNELRSLDHFWETRFLEDESIGEFIRDKNGEVILDPENEKIKPW